MKNKFLLLVTALVISTTVTFASNKITGSDSGIVTYATNATSETTEIVHDYMVSQNIMPAYITRDAGTSNYRVKDCDGVWYIVYIDNGVIRGHEEVDF
jgi:hypothetical protein